MVEGEEVFDAGAFAGKGGGAVGAVYGAVEGGVGFGQAGGHRDGVVKVGECRAFFQMLRPHVQDGLGEAFNLRAAGGGDFFGPREIVVNEFVRVAVVGF